MRKFALNMTGPPCCQVRLDDSLPGCQSSFHAFYKLTTTSPPARLINSRQNMIAVKFFPFFVTILQVKGDCPTGGCQTISLDVHRDAVLDTEFVGHVFHNSVTLNPVQCYTLCIQNCRCLSLNYKENNEKRYCELNEGNHFTNKSSLKHSPGSSYYTLLREQGTKVNN